MKNDRQTSISPLLKLFYESTSLPVTVFEKKSLCERYALAQQDYNLPLLLYSSLSGDLPNVWYACTPEEVYFAGIHLPGTDTSIMLGPTLLIDCTKHEALRITIRIGRRTEDLDTVRQYFDSIHPHSIAGIKASIQLLCRLLDLEVPEDIPQVGFQWNLPYKVKTRIIEEEEGYSNPDLEHQILTCIQQGDLSAIKKLYREVILPLKIGEPNDLISIKIYISTANMIASRQAMQSGVDYTRANATYNRFLEKILVAQSMPELTECFYALIQEYTKMNAELSELSSGSILVRRISQYTKSHITEKLSTSVFAEELGMNAAYLSTHFKKETGKTIGAFIQEEKIREAKRLLLESDLSLAEISSFLNFSSESYFCAVFKKNTGMTPQVYRQE
ncbi:MAG: AraC family transcriptional regulator [Clostridiales bacterium]|nr:AraC family transcriptional regulator [Clostridiales bacterium]